MKLWPRIKQLSLGQLWKFFILFLKHPRYVIPSLKATQHTFQLCNERFGNSHHSTNKANAFRHSLWNVFLCQNAHKLNKNKQKSVFWAQKVTDLYEKVTQNNGLDDEMDLHNNAIGRAAFLNTLGQNQAEIIEYLLVKSEKAVKIDHLDQILEVKNQMVYISE